MSGAAARSFFLGLAMIGKVLAFLPMPLRGPCLRAPPSRSPSKSCCKVSERSQSDFTKLNLLFSQDMEAPEKGYDVIVVGSGNGACGFLNNYLQYAPEDARILVLEEGKNFFYTSDITHQNDWTKSYSEGNIFKLHNARTFDGKPILSGRACTMGGGGSINYTMIHESSKWLAKHLGHTISYWDDLKTGLNSEFNRNDPTERMTPITRLILESGETEGFQAPKKEHLIKNIPSYEDDDAKQLYQFPTQFDTFGQRTNSGVSIVDWDDPRLHLKTQVKVVEITFQEETDEAAQCSGLVEKDLDSGQTNEIRLAEGGRLILCAGAATPRLLLPHRDSLENAAIGEQANDHILFLLGIYKPSKDLEVSSKDIYGPVFGTTVWKAKENGFEDGEDIVVSVDFFTGTLQKLLYMTSHLFLAFLPNCIKSPMLRRPWLFVIVKNSVRTLVSVLNLVITFVTWGEDLEYVTSIIKYNAAKTGQYEDDGRDRITLGWFEDKQDKAVAKDIIPQLLPLLNELGEEPHWLIRLVYRLFTKVPFKASQVDRYVDHVSKKSLLSEQHMAGGCVFGHAVDLGEDDKSQTGKVYGTSNVHVADLSACPLPRVSPQMTAYLVGYHVSHQIYSK